MLTLKDVIAINEEFDTGKLVNKGSLELALTYAKRTTNWAKGLAWLMRAILIDHAFEDGNKRTAAALLYTEAYNNGFAVDKDRLTKLIEHVLLKNITGIRKLEEMIKNVVQ